MIDRIIEGVKTEDTTGLIAWVFLTLIAGFLFLGMMLRRRENKEEERK